MDDTLELLAVSHEQTLVYDGADVLGVVWLYVAGYRAEGRRANGPFRRTLREAVADLEAMR